MKKIITILTCLTVFVSVAIAQGKPGDREAYVNMEEEFSRSTLIEDKKTTNYAINVPDGFKTFYDRKAEDVLYWEYTDADGNVQSGNDGKYTYMDKKVIDAAGKIEIVYDVLYDSIRVYYTSLYSSFDLAKATRAVNTVVQHFEILKEFETGDGELIEKPRYYEWAYYHGNDKFGRETQVRSYRDKSTKIKYTEYYAHIKFKTQ